MLDRRVRSADDLAQLMTIPVLAALVKPKPTFGKWLAQWAAKAKFKPRNKGLGVRFT
jgi:hypothetical protein